MRAFVILSIFGCAACAPHKTTSPSVPRSGQCTIADVHWPNAEDSYDRPATIDALTALETVIRDASTVGPDEIARRLDTLFRKPPGTAFVSKWAAEVATRLRQLACAEQAGTISREVAGQRYVQVIVDLEDERAVIIDEMRRHEP